MSRNERAELTIHSSWKLEERESLNPKIISIILRLPKLTRLKTCFYTDSGE